MSEAGFDLVLLADLEPVFPRADGGGDLKHPVLSIPRHVHRLPAHVPLSSFSLLLRDSYKS